MRFPNVLIIGAMKAGTTSLYVDLVEHPNVFFPADKEPHALSSDEVLTEAGLRRYANLYVKARNDQLLIDASTSYSKRPDFDGVAQRALTALPEDFKVIYVVRHPIDRIVSQHYHEYSAGLVGASIDEAVRRHRRFVDYSRYSYQLSPWIGAIGLNRISVVRFEDYVNQRAVVLRQLFDFLELSQDFRASEQGKVYNSSQGKPVRNRFWTAVRDNSVYRRGLRPILPAKLRLALERVVLPRAPQRPAAPQPETIRWLRDALSDDVAQLSETLQNGSPLWHDFAMTRTGAGER